MAGPEERISRVAPLLLAAACLIPFANGLSGDFTYDDKAIVRDNVRIQSPETLGQIFETPYFGGARGSGAQYRPILLLTFAVQWWVHGKRVVPFHVVNLLFHAAATLLLWKLWRRLLVPPAAALAAALLFAVHPIHVEAVTSLVGRGETQAAVLTLLYVHVALPGLEERGRRKGAALAAALFLYLLALLTKESAATAPVLAFLCAFRLAEGGTGRRLAAAFRRGASLYVGSAVALAAYFGSRVWVLGGAIKGARTGIFEVENPLAPLAAPARVANACLILLRYLGRIILPLRLSADESAWAIRPLPATSLAAAGAVLLLALAAAAALARPRSTAGFGLLFFGAAILPASNLLFPIGTIFAERVTYLASGGICLAAGAAIAGAAEQMGALTPARRAVLAAAVLLLSVRTAMRATVWSSDESLFENSALVEPRSAKNHYNLGYIRAEDQRFREGLEAYRRSTETYPKYWDAWAGKGRCERQLGMLTAAKRSYERALEALPTYENGFFGLGLVLEDEGRDREALEAYRRGLAKNAASLPLAFREATVASRLGDPSAGALWRKLLDSHPGSLPSRYGYAVWLRGQGDVEASRRQLRKILESAPRDVGALRLLAEEDAGSGRLFGAGLAREKAFRASRGIGDLLLLLEAANSDPAYRRRFDFIRPRLEVLAPWAFAYAGQAGGGG